MASALITRQPHKPALVIGGCLVAAGLVVLPIIGSIITSKPTPNKAAVDANVEVTPDTPAEARRKLILTKIVPLSSLVLGIVLIVLGHTALKK
jgi:dipeptide/tripeptide permease